MTDRDALYAAVLAAPDDDTPRLVYADFLDDTGVRADAIRARFISNQIALARAEPWSEEYDRLHRATAPVEDHYRKEWAADLEGGFGRGSHFSRGFVAQVMCDLPRFLSDGMRVFDRHPVRGVKFTTARAHGAYSTLAVSPLLARIHTLHASGEQVDDIAAERLAASPHIVGLRCLRVTRSALSIAGLGRLVSLTRSGLRELELYEHRAIGEAEVVRLVATGDKHCVRPTGC
ncbi:TIGR02996 domain-containing protein [bacterium]|nr:TIGR02996 domain-containing protein [bacterium]